MNGLNGALDDPVSFFNAVTGFAGPTANYALFFIRDLFVSTLIIRLIAPALPRFGFVFLAIAGIMALTGTGAPVIFRPTILLFFLAGSLWAIKGRSVADLGSARMAIIVGGAAMAYWFLARLVPSGNDPHVAGILRSSADIGLRLALTIWTATVAGWLTHTRTGLAIAPFGSRMYLGYLMHIPLIGALWVIWARLVGNEFQPSYLIFYLACPFVAAFAGALLSAALDHAPILLQRLLRGKARSRISRKEAAQRAA